VSQQPADDGTHSESPEHLWAGVRLLSAAAFLLMFLPLIVFFALQRYFVQGLLAGSVKT
jgi:alpha-glucoside transport system permease protein